MQLGHERSVVSELLPLPTVKVVGNMLLGLLSWDGNHLLILYDVPLFPALPQQCDG